MRYEATDLLGVFVLQPEPYVDPRGVFARTWDTAEAGSQGLDTRIAQCSTSYNSDAGTLRGMHFQDEPWAETKLVRCTSGAIFDVAVDLRPSSTTYLKWFGLELSAENRRALYIPTGCAHGFLTLLAGSEVFYQISTPYHPAAARGARWDDPAFAIGWPREPTVISDKDAAWPAYDGGSDGTVPPIG